MPAEEFTPSITISSRGALRLKAGHLWVYRSDISKAESVAAGALVHVQDERGRKLGTALYSSSSQIAIRLLTSRTISEPELPPLLRQRIDDAAAFRRKNVHDF